MKKTAAVQSLSALMLFLAFLSVGSVQAQCWSVMESSTSRELHDIWGTSGSDIFAAGADGTILHYNGTVWTNMDSGVTCTLKKIYGSSSTHVNAVCADGSVIRYNGTTWSALNLPKPGKALSDIWGPNFTQLFAVGAGGATEKLQLLQWVSMESGTTSDLHKVWGASAKNVFAVGASGKIAHYDGNAGNTWAAMSSGTARDLFGVRGNTGSNVFAVGAGGEIAHYNGQAWSAMPSGTVSNLADIWLTSGGEAFAVGESGEIVYYNGLTWSAMPSGTTSDLNKVWGLSGNAVYAVGDNGTILQFHAAATTTTVPPDASTSSISITATSIAPATTIATTSTTAATTTTTTTTTVSFTSTTSTTAVQPCLFHRSFAGGENAQSLRELRNQKLHTVLGALLAAMYYENIDEVGAILQSNTGLNARFSLITGVNMPAVRELVLYGGATIRSSRVIQLHDFLIDLQAQAGLKLSLDISFILQGLESGWLLPWLGIALERE